MTRALVLSGGGIRVAWQTGVVAALHDAGLSFTHADGTSGGLFTLGMLLSGQQPDEMIRRWRGLNPRAFLSLLPLRSYLRSPTSWPAFGGSAGIRRTVLPGLGIDLARVRAATAMTGSFNATDFGRKKCVAIPHTEIDEDLLVAGVSLAGVMPAVEHGGTTWTDAVWIKDANLTEAVRRGATEIWLVWSIGNTPYWGNGALEQYVHMMEMSSSAGLQGELEMIADVNRRRAAGETVLGSTEQITVHAVVPPLPLPLDPELVTGRIDAETLIAMGYRDAWRYLDAMRPEGIDLATDPSFTPARRPGARIVLRSAGTLRAIGAMRGSRRAECTVVVEADDLARLRGPSGGPFGIAGALDHPDHGYRSFVDGRAHLLRDGRSRTLHVTASLLLDGERCELRIAMPVARTGHRWVLADASGTVRETGTAAMTSGQACRALLSFAPSGTHDLVDRARVLRDSVRLVAAAPATTRSAGVPARA